MVAFGFLPQNFERSQEPTLSFYECIPLGSGDIQTQPYAKEFV